MSGTGTDKGEILEIDGDGSEIGAHVFVLLFQYSITLVLVLYLI